MLAQLNTLPLLLDRPAAIQYGKEWENVQNHYGQARQAMLDDPNDMNAHLKLVEVFINEARVTGEHGHYYPAALRTLEQVLQQDSLDGDTHFRALSLRASVLLSQHEFEAALAAGQTAVRLNPYNAQIFGVLVDAHVEMGQYEAAVQMADRMVGIRPDLRSYSRVAYLRELHGDLPGAIEAMQLAVQAGYPGQEQTCWAQLQLGQLYVANGNFKLARQVYEQALGERPDYPFGLAALAELAIHEADYEQAETLLKKACAIIPEVGFYEQLASLYFDTDRGKAAMQLVPQILDMLGEDTDSGHNMNLEYANVHLHLTHQYDRALQYALDEYQLRPTNLTVNEQLAHIYFALENYEQAQKHAEVANRLKTDSAELLCLLGLAKIELGEASNGRQLLQQSFSQNPHQQHQLADLGRQHLK